MESYDLDLDGRPVSVTNVEGQTMSMAYTVGDRLAWMTRFDGTVVSNRYEENGWLAQTVYPDSSLNFTYRRNGLLQTAVNEAGQVSNRYDAANRLAGTTGVGPGGEVSYGYLPGGQVTNVAHVGGGVGVDYDRADRVVEIQAGADSFGFLYNTNSGLLSACSNAALGVSYANNSMDWLTNLVWRNGTGGVVRSFAYGLNAVGMITNIVRENGERVRYTLDNLDRLVGEEVRNASDQVLYSATYAFDLAGNRTRTVIDSVTSDYTLGQGNRLDAFGDGWAGYDAAGCVTAMVYSATQRLDLTWNGRYEMTATATNGGACERFGYDAMGRRAWTWDGVTTNWHVYDGAQVVADVDANGGLVRTYVWGPGIDNLLSMTVCTGATAVTYYAVKDHLGTVQALVGGNGAVVESYRFDAWGKVLGVYDGTGTAISGSQLGNRYLWQGREYSWRTGLYYFRARWYDPVTGRWLSNDPIGVSGGLNQYVFCGNGPVNFRDPFGMDDEEVIRPRSSVPLVHDGSRRIRDYKSAIMRDRFSWRFWRNPYGWSLNHDTAANVDEFYTWINNPIPGNNFGNRNAGYSLTKAFGPFHAALACYTAEVITFWGDRNTWWNDSIGSFKDNGIGIFWGVATYFPFSPSPEDPPENNPTLINY